MIAKREGFTAGPWRAAAGGWIVSESGVRVGRVFERCLSLGFDKEPEYPKEVAQNARLIAAAPEMVEALRDLVQAHDTGMRKSAVKLRVDIARAILARVEGGEWPAHQPITRPVNRAHIVSAVIRASFSGANVW